MSEIDDRLAARGITLGAPAAPAANYVPVRRSGNTLYISGQISSGPNGLISGKLGETMDVAAGQRAAEACAIALLAQIRHAAEAPLEKVRFVKLSVLVNAAPDFLEHHLVANGASDLLVAVLGEAGGHARAAFGTASLPLGAAVEIEAVVDLIE